MAFYFQKTYSPEIEQLLCQYSQSLSEKDRRRCAALEAIKLGHGGTRYIAKVLGGDPQTVQDGMRELNKAPCGRTFKYEACYQGPDSCAVDSYLPRLISSP